MKIRIGRVLLLGFLVLASSAAADDPPPPLDPPEVPVHPVLEEQYLSFFPPEVLKVTDGVYVARGYNRDNPALIEGIDGLIVVDPGESVAAGQAAKNAFDKHPDLNPSLSIFTTNM